MPFQISMEKWKDPVLFLFLYFILTAVFIAPIWSTQILPMSDFHVHLGIVDIIHNYHRIPLYQEYYEFSPFPTSNILFHYCTHYLAYLFPIEVAGKIMVSLYVAIFPLSLYYLLVTLGRQRLLFVLAYPFIYNFSFSMGFIGYCFSIVLFIFGISLVYRLALNPQSRYRWGVLFITLLLFFVHLHTYLFFCFIAIVELFYLGFFKPTLEKGYYFCLTRTHVRQFFSGLTPILLSAILFLWWFLKYLIMYDPNPTRMVYQTERFFGSVHLLFYDVFFVFHKYLFGITREGGEKGILAYVLILVLLLMLLSRKTPQDKPVHLQLSLLGLLFFIVLVTYFILPLHIKSSFYINCRQPIYLPLLLIGMIQVDFHRFLVRILFVILIGLLVFLGLYWGESFKRFDRESAPFHEILREIPPQKRLLHGIFHSFSRVMLNEQYRHISHYYTVRNHGLTGFSFLLFSGQPLRLQKFYQDKTITSREGLKTAGDVSFFDYLLIRDLDKKRDDGQYPWLRFIASRQEWFLYQIVKEKVPRESWREKLYHRNYRPLRKKN